MKKSHFLPLLILINCLHLGLSTCPCNITDDVFQCDEDSLENFPDDYYNEKDCQKWENQLENVGFVKLSRQKNLTQLGHRAFQDFPNAKFIQIMFTQLTDISYNAFYDVPKVKKTIHFKSDLN